MFNLNNKEEFNTGSSIFNNGIAGVVENVEIRVEKKTSEDHENAPDYKLFVKDDKGEINGGFYIPSQDSSKSEEENNKVAKREVGRIVGIARAVMGEEYSLPEVQTAKEAYDKLFLLVKENSEGKKFNVFVTYGYTARPSKYLGLRYFDFIEEGGKPSKLATKASDVLERIDPDKTSKASNDDEGWL